MRAHAVALAVTIFALTSTALAAVFAHPAVAAAKRSKPTLATTTTTARPPATTPTTVPALAGTAGSVLFGAVTAGGPWELSRLRAFEADAGKRVSLYSYYQSFALDPNFDAAAAGAVRARGAIPMISWEPWDPTTDSPNQPAYSLRSVAAGAHDEYIRRWAAQVASWGQPLWLRFAHEMNGNWYPWGAAVNGNGPGDYVAAWRHVHDIFRQLGARVTWVWSPNVIMAGTPSLAELYPGDGYVDWLGVDGYNWGTTQSGGGTWQTPAQVFGPTFAALRALSSRPIVVAETASTEVGGDKAGWIRQLFSWLMANPDVKAFVWFNLDKETDWRIESSSGAQAAFAAGVSDPRYRAG